MFNRKWRESIMPRWKLIGALAEITFLKRELHRANRILILLGSKKGNNIWMP